MKIINALKGNYVYMEEVGPGAVIEHEGSFYLVDDSEEAYEGVNISNGELKRFCSDDEVIIRDATVTIRPEAE